MSSIDDFLWDEQDKPRRPGRPRGSKNRSPESIVTEEKLQSMFKRMMPHLTPDQRSYLEGMLNGEIETDAEKAMDLAIKQMLFVFSEAADAHWQAGRVSKELADTFNAVRMALKDLEDIRKVRADKAEKAQAMDNVSLEDREKEKQRLEQMLAKFVEQKKTES